MHLTEFDFKLPKTLIAQYPSHNRTDSRLLVAPSAVLNSPPIDTHFKHIGDFLKSGDLLVMNDTRVIPARLFARKASGGKVEIMIERLLNGAQVLAMIKASKAPKIGSFIELEAGSQTVAIEVLDKQNGLYTLEFDTDSFTDSLTELLNQVGHIPLPPYIERADEVVDLARYQTVYAQNDGAVAAPTAGLHFDAALLQSLKSRGIEHTFITLHVGAGTFQPVRSDNILDHKMHSEWFEISQLSADKITQTKANGGRIIAVGTTAVRTLESVAKNGVVRADSGETEIFIYPGFEFQIVDALITNFHLPKSSLLMLVSAFIGRQRMLQLYAHAIEQNYRFFSYGDAMLLNKSRL